MCTDQVVITSCLCVCLSSLSINPCWVWRWPYTIRSAAFVYLLVVLRQCQLDIKKTIRTVNSSNQQFLKVSFQKFVNMPLLYGNCGEVDWSKTLADYSMQSCCKEWSILLHTFCLLFLQEMVVMMSVWFKLLMLVSA